MRVFRRAAAVALFDRDTCREILYDPRVIFQGLVVLAAVFASSALWAFVDPEGSNTLLSSTGEPEYWRWSAWSAVGQAAIVAVVWAAGVVVVMAFGRRVMASDFAPRWRSFTSLWCFAAAPWAAVSLISTGLSTIGHGADVGRVGVAGCAAGRDPLGDGGAGARGEARIRLGVHGPGEHPGGRGVGHAEHGRLRLIVPARLL